MIKNKYDLNIYIKEDLKANGILCKGFSGVCKLLYKSFIDRRLRYMLYLRKEEYFLNTSTILLHKLLYLYYKFKRQRLGELLGFSISANSLGKGVRLAHVGSIIINGSSKIGDHCTIHGCVNIASRTSIGNNVYIGPGAKIFSDIKIADNVRIGANAVVTKSFTEPNITILGVPAKKSTSLSNN